MSRLNHKNKLFLYFLQILKFDAQNGISSVGYFPLSYDLINAIRNAFIVCFMQANCFLDSHR